MKFNIRIYSAIAVRLTYSADFAIDTNFLKYISLSSISVS